MRTAGEPARLESRPAAPAAVGAPSGRGGRLWLFFVAAFLLQFSAWAAWFVIAGHHPVQEVPLVRR